MTYEEWKEARRKGIGGSDAPAALGLSPWKTPYALYLEKRGEGPEQEDNEYMAWGRRLEPVIRQRYADQTGYKVEVPSRILYHPKLSFIFCNVDGIAHANGGQSRVVEIKNTRTDIDWGEPGTDQIPEHYLVQVQHNMMVMGLPLADVPVLIGGSDFRIYKVEADAELQDIILARERLFWERVQNGMPPEPVTVQDMQTRFGSISKSVQVQADMEALEAIGRLREIREMKKEEEELRAIVMRTLGEADTLVNGDAVIATWKLTKPSRKLDGKKLKEAEPEIWEKYAVDTKPSRRFLVK